MKIETSTSRRLAGLNLITLLLATLLGVVNSAQGVSAAWVTTAAANWGAAASWQGGVLPTFDNSLDVAFGSIVTETTYLQAARTIRSLNFVGASAASNIRLTIEAGSPNTAVNLTIGGAGGAAINTDAASSGNIVLGTTSVGGNIVLAENLTVTLNGSGTFTIGRPITGAFSVTKNGSGTLLFPNLLLAASTYTGGTIINAGTVKLAVNANRLAATGPMTIANDSTAILDFNGCTAQTVGLLTGTGPNGSIMLGAGTLTVNSTATTTFGGSISGTGAVTKSGTGALTLSGANAYSGATTVSGGTLNTTTASTGAGSYAVSDSAALGVSIASPGQSLNMSSLTLGSVSGPSTLNIILGGNDPTATVIADAGALTLNGTATVNVSGGASLSGATIVLLSYGSAAGAGSFSAGTLPSVAGYSTALVNDTGAKQLKLVFTALPSAMQWSAGSGNWDTTAANWQPVGGGSAVKYVEGSTVTFDDNGTGGGPITVTLTANRTPASVTVNNSAKDYVLTGSAINSTAALSKSGSSQLTLSGANGYSGGTTVNAGTLALNGSGTLGSTSGALTAAGGILDLGTASQTAGTVTISGGTIANGTLTGTSYSGQSGTVSAVLAGSGVVFTKTTTNTLTLSGANSYSGGTTVSAGTLALSGSGTLGDGTGALAASGGILDLGTTSQTAGAVTLSGGTITNGTLTGTSYDGQSGNVSGVLAGSGVALTKSVTGTLILSGNNTFSGGVNLSAGIINVQHDNAFGSGTLTLAGGQWNGGASCTIANNIVISANSLGNALSATNEFTGQINGTGQWQVSGTAAGILKLSGDNSGWTGNFKFGPSAGGETVQLNHVNALGAGTTLTFGDAVAGTLESLVPVSLSQNIVLGSSGSISQVLKTTADMTVSGVISGPAGKGIIKTGTGILTLANANTYTGATTVSNGTLLVNGSLAAGSVVINAATLGGTGTIAGAVTNLAGSTLQPGAGGAAIGTLTFGSTVGLAGNTVLNLNRGASPNASKLAANSTLTMGGTLTVNNVGAAPVAGDSFTIFTVTAPPGGAFTTTTLPALGAGLNWWQTVEGGNISLVVNQAPTARAISMGAQSGEMQVLRIIGGKYAPTDADGDALSVATVQNPSTRGGAVNTDGTNVTYTAAGAFTGTDDFTYTISDGRGGFATNTVTVQVEINGAGFNLISGPVNNGNGTATINYAGIPGYNYALETTASLTTLPIYWTPIITNTVNPNGQLSFTFSTGAGQGFFRTRYVP